MSPVRPVRVDPDTTETADREPTRTDHELDRGAFSERDERHGGDEHTIPADLAAIEAGDVLCDRHRRECFLVRGIDGAGVSLRQEEDTYYVPHSLFAPWYGSRLFPITETATTEPPDWCTDENSG